MTFDLYKDNMVELLSRAGRWQETMLFNFLKCVLVLDAFLKRMIIYLLHYNNKQEVVSFRKRQRQWERPQRQTQMSWKRNEIASGNSSCGIQGALLPPTMTTIIPKSEPRPRTKELFPEQRPAGRHMATHMIHRLTLHQTTTKTTYNYSNKTEIAELKPSGSVGWEVRRWKNNFGIMILENSRVGERRGNHEPVRRQKVR